jgi:DNA-binding MarR family transcriptional regulator
MARKSQSWEVFAMPHHPAHKEKAWRAFGAYMDVLETAEWLKGELRGPLLLYDLAMGDFRLLELLYREGTLFVSDIARRRNLQRQAVHVVVERLAKRGLVRRAIAKLPPVEFERAHLPASMRDARREGVRVGVVGLTKSGKKFMGNVLPNHTKVVRALMRALTAREQDTLSRLCRKLRAGDVMKFISEITMQDED